MLPPRPTCSPLAEVARVWPSGTARLQLLRLLAAALFTASAQPEVLAKRAQDDAEGDAENRLPSNWSSWMAAVVQAAHDAERGQVNDGDAYSHELQALLSLQAAALRFDSVVWQSAEPRHEMQLWAVRDSPTGRDAQDGAVAAADAADAAAAQEHKEGEVEREGKAAEPLAAGCIDSAAAIDDSRHSPRQLRGAHNTIEFSKEGAGQDALDQPVLGTPGL